MKQVVSGLAAVVAFGFALSLFRLPFWLALVVGAACYVGLHLLLREDRRPSSAPPDLGGVDEEWAHRVLRAARDTIADLRLAGREIPKPEVRQKIESLCELLDRTVDVLESDPRKMPRVAIFLTLYLPATRRMVRRYTQLSRQGGNSPEIARALSSFEGSLEEIRTTFQRVHDRLLRDDVVDLETDVTVFRQMMEQEEL